MKQKIVISHCRRRDLGGEDIALEKINEEKENISLNLHSYNKNLLICAFEFIFSLKYLFFVLKNRHKRHIICNPFPKISFISLALLIIARVPLRLYIHNFSMNCIGGASYSRGERCKKYKQQRYCLDPQCCISASRYLLNLVKHYLFYKLFLSYKKNKIYFVSQYQANLAKSSGLIRKNYIIAGNID